MGLLTALLDFIEYKLSPDSPRFSLPKDPKGIERMISERNYEYFRNSIKKSSEEKELTRPCYECNGTREDKNDYNPATGEYYPCKVCHGMGEIPVDEDGRLK